LIPGMQRKAVNESAMHLDPVSIRPHGFIVSDPSLGAAGRRLRGNPGPTPMCVRVGTVETK
jgi:hypothetical protein